MCGRKGRKVMVDRKKVEQAVRLLLEGIGEDVNREGLRDTPDRQEKGWWRRRIVSPECTKKFAAEWMRMQEST